MAVVRCCSCIIDAAVRVGACWQRCVCVSVCGHSGFLWGVVIALTRQNGDIKEFSRLFLEEKYYNITFKSGQTDNRKVKA